MGPGSPWNTYHVTIGFLPISDPRHANAAEAQ
jgi:hypothetical protein